MAASTVMSDVVGKVTFVHKLPMIVKATSDDDTPTAGYLYQEISDLTYVSSNYCKALLDVLVDRLDKPSHHIKFKVLRVMKYVVENGSEEFRNGLLRRSTGVQLATKFSGPPDPLHGNAPYIAVRSAAKELSEILFDTEQSKSKEPSHKMATVAGGLGTSRSGSSMQGFGNTETPVHKQKSLGDTIKEGFRQLADSFRDPPAASTRGSAQGDYRPLGGSELDRSSSASFVSSSGRQKALLGAESADRLGEYKPVVVDVGEAPRVRSCQPGNRDVGRVTSAHKQGRPAGGWEEGSGGRGSNASNSDGQHSGDSTDLSERLESVSVEDVSMETKLVEDFVNASNGKPTPSRDALAQFVKRCTTLNCEKVTELLGLELQSTSVPVQMRCLCALEALMREDIASTEHLHGFIPDALKKVQAQTADRLLQAKASKILRQLERTQEEAIAAKFTKRQDSFTRSVATQQVLDIQQTHVSNNQRSTSNTQESLASKSQNEKSLLPYPVDSALGFSESSTLRSKSLFAGMEVGSTSGQRGPETQRIVQLDEKQWRESLGVENDKNAGVKTAGQTQLLDDLLDLSSTDQPTLAPGVGTSLQTDLTTNLQPVSEDSSRPLVRFDKETNESVKSADGNQSDAFEEFSTNGQSIAQGTGRQIGKSTTGNSAEHDSTKVMTNPRKPDSIMSRSANFDDLIATTGIAVPTGSVKKTGPSSIGESSPKLSRTRPMQSHTAALNANQISTLYPQLAGVNLSGTTAVPLKLSQRPPDGNFAFVSKNGGKENSQRASSFDFVKEAMKASKK